MAKQSRAQYLSGAAAKRAVKHLDVLQGAIDKVASAKTDKARATAQEHACKKITAIREELTKVADLSAEQE